MRYEMRQKEAAKNEKVSCCDFNVQEVAQQVGVRVSVTVCSPDTVSCTST